MTTTLNRYNATVQDIAMITRNYLESSENMNTQFFLTADGGAIVQGKLRGGSFKQFMGLDRATTVKITPISDTHVNIEIGEGKWTDKGVAMTVSLFVLWPLAVTSGVGMYKQHKLPQNIINAITNGLFAYVR
ncbi:MAG: hypothetical protein E7628_07455 [Ruminococcaceae bacterium]|nr:hypothetical protein [Oscillospiraceae bacterium]